MKTFSLRPHLSRLSPFAPRRRPPGGRSAAGRAALLVLLGVGWIVGSLPPARAAGTGSLSTLLNFDGTDGDSPVGRLVEDGAGNFYGTTSAGGADNYGTVFEVTSAGVFTLLHSFNGTSGDGPNGGLVLGTDGNFYGTTYYGGADNYGTAYKITPAGVFTLLHSFSGANGENPEGALALGADGNFYGTTVNGNGSNDDGVVYQLTPAGVCTVLHNFSGTDGSHPAAGLVLGSDGNLYGTTATGGANGDGTVFQVTLTGGFTTLHSFGGASDGEEPTARLVQGSDGSFYGTTYLGGASGYGTVYKITAAGGLTTLYSFTGSNDGRNPTAELVQGSDGNFYGTTFGNDTNVYGTIYQMTPAGGLAALHSFSNSDGSEPAAGLVLGSDGSFYGTASAGGSDSNGTVFKFTVTGSYPAFFTGQASLAGGVFYLAFPSGNFFGYYSFLTNPAYIYHFDLGYEYVFDADDAQNGVYLYDFASGDFFYTSPTFPFPYLYDLGLQATLYYYPDTTSPGHYTGDPRYFFDFSTGKIITR